MLLPHWTDGCIGSMEGLFFEASGTTPYHFLTVASMSKQSSNPVRELRYENTNAAVGVREMRTLGVRYAMVRTPEAKTQAAAQPELVLVGSSGPWDIYEVTDSVVVEPLTVQPVVVRGRPGDARERNLELGTSWFQHPEEWAAMPADDGPAEWQRISVQVDLERREGEPGDSGRKRRHRRAGRADRAGGVAAGRGVRCADRPAVAVVLRRPGRRAGRRQGQLLPELGGVGGTRPVSHRAEHDGGRPDGQRGRADVRSKRRRLAVHVAHGGRHRAVHLLAGPRRRAARRRGPGVRPAGGGGLDATPTTGGVGVVERVEADHDPWAPDRFEPHGIAEEDRWIRPRPAPPPTTADEPVDLEPPRWSGDEPDAPLDRPDDPSR